MITAMANRYFTFWRPTAYAMNAATAAASMTLDRTVPAGAYLQITVSAGTDGSGSVTVAGTDTTGATASEALVFSANGTQVTTKRWGTVTGITTTGLAGETTPPTVAAQAVSADGTPHQVRYSVATARPVMLQHQGGADDKAMDVGSILSDKAVIAIDFESAWTPTAADVGIDDETGEEWLVRGVRAVRFGFGLRTNHYSLQCSRLPA